MATKSKSVPVRSLIKAPTDHPFIDDDGARELHLEMQRIEKKYGYVRPETILEEAKKNHRSRFGKHLEWDDAKASDQFRLVQIRRLIITVREVVMIGEKRVEVNAWQSVTRHTPDFSGRIRVSTKRAFSNPDWAEQIVVREMKELRRVRARLQAYVTLRQVFASLISAIDDLDEGFTSGALMKKPKK